MAKKEVTAILRLAGQLDPSLKKSFAAAAREASKIGKTQKGFKIISKAAKAAAVATAAATAAVAKYSISVGTSFESGMSQVAATMGTTTDQIQNLSQLAKDMGATTKFSATEASEALNYMALAGWDAQKMTTALPRILDLAAAGGMDLARASDIVTDSIAALGLEFTDLEPFVDQMSKTSQKTNTSVEQLGEAILTVGGTAKNLKGGMTEMNAALGIMANVGVKGSEGGTALRNTIQSLTSSKGIKGLKNLGISVADVDGNLRSLPDIMGDLNKSLDGMGTAERANVLGKIFNKRDLKALEGMMGTTAEEWAALMGTIEESEGSAAQQAKTLLDNLQGDFTIFKSAMEGAGIEIYEGMAPALREIVQGFTGVFDELRKNGQLKKISGIFGNVFSTIGKLAQKAIPVVVKLLDSVLPVLGNVLDALMPIVDVGWELFSSIIEPLMPLISSLVQNLLPPLASIVAIIGQALLPVVQMLFGLVQQVLGPILPMLSTLLNALLPPIAAVLGVIVSILSPIFSVLSALVDAVMPHLQKLLEWIGEKLQGLTPIIQFIGKLIEGITDAVSGLIGWVSDGVGKVTGFFEDIFGGADKADKKVKELNDSTKNVGKTTPKSSIFDMDIPKVDYSTPTVDVSKVPMGQLKADMAITPTSVNFDTAQLNTAVSTSVQEAQVNLGEIPQAATETWAQAQQQSAAAVQQLSAETDSSLAKTTSAFTTAYNTMRASLNAFISTTERAISALSRLGTKAQAANKLKNVNVSSVKGFALGGILRATPGGALVNVAEGSSDEAIIPINRSPRSLGLLAEAASRMGVAAAPAMAGMSVQFNPSITIQGDADKGVIEEALAIAQAKFEEYIETYLERKERESYG